MLRFKLSCIGRDRHTVVQCVRLSEVYAKLYTFKKGYWQYMLGPTAGGLGIYASTLVSLYYPDMLPGQHALLTCLGVSLVSGLVFRCGRENMRATLPYLRQYQPVGISLDRRITLASHLDKSFSRDIQRIAFLLIRKEYDKEGAYGLIHPREDEFGEHAKDNLYQMHVPVNSFIDTAAGWPHDKDLRLRSWEKTTPWNLLSLKERFRMIPRKESSTFV